MAPLTKGRTTPQAGGDMRGGSVAAATVIFAGALVMRDAAGDLVQGQTTVGLVGVGRAEEHVDNSQGAAGDEALKFQPGIFRYANSAAADEITDADIGAKCFAVDDQTVAKTDGGATRSPAGVVDAVDANGVWVRFDAALTSNI